MGGKVARASCPGILPAGGGLGGRGWGEMSLGSVNLVGGSLGWRRVTGLSEPGYNGGLSRATREVVWGGA